MNPISQLADWPVPLFKLNGRFEILDRSGKAEEMFGKHQAFLELVDEDSRKKARQFLASSKGEAVFELTLIRADGDRILADVSSRWGGDGTCNVSVTAQSGHLQEVSNKLSSLRMRLNETNYDLLLEKERVQQLLQKVQELSAPSIELGSGYLLVPLFGDLDAGKTEALRPRLLNAIYEKDPDIVILDLTALEAVGSEGIKWLAELMQTLQIMGIKGVLTGMKPQHAKLLHDHPAVGDLHFESSLESLLAGRGLNTSFSSSV